MTGVVLQGLLKTTGNVQTTCHVVAVPAASSPQIVVIQIWPFIVCGTQFPLTFSNSISITFGHSVVGWPKVSELTL